MDPNTPSQLSQVILVAVFLWLFAWLPVIVHPTFRKDRAATTGFLALVAAATVGIGIAGAYLAPALGGLLIVVYALGITVWTVKAVKARHRVHTLKTNINREIDRQTKAREKTEREPFNP